MKQIEEDIGKNERQIKGIRTEDKEILLDTVDTAELR